MNISATRRTYFAVLLVIALMGPTSLFASDVALAWRTTVVHSPYLKDCWTFGKNAMRALGYGTPTTQRNSYEAHKSGVRVVLTCMQSKQVMALVIGAGADQQMADAVVKELTDRMAGATRID